MEILKFGDYSNYEKIGNEIVRTILYDDINESNSGDIDSILKKIIKQLNLDVDIFDKFSNCLTSINHLVESLMENTKLNIESSDNNIVMLSLTSISIMYLSEIHEEELKSGVKKLTSELQLIGIGNGIVKKVIKCLESIIGIISQVLDRNIKVSEILSDDILLGDIIKVSNIIKNKKYNIDNFSQNLSMISDTLLGKNSAKSTPTIKDGEVGHMGKSELIKEQ